MHCVGCAEDAGATQRGHVGAKCRDQGKLAEQGQALEVRLRAAQMCSVPNDSDRVMRELGESDRLELEVRRLRVRWTRPLPAAEEDLEVREVVEDVHRLGLPGPPRDEEEFQRQLAFLDLLLRQVHQRREKILRKHLIRQQACRTNVTVKLDPCEDDPLGFYMEQGRFNTKQLRTLLVLFLDEYSEATMDYVDNFDEKLLVLLDVFLLCYNMLDHQILLECPSSGPQGACGEQTSFPGRRGRCAWMEWVQRVEAWQRLRRQNAFREKKNERSQRTRARLERAKGQMKDLVAVEEPLQQCVLKYPPLWEWNEWNTQQASDDKENRNPSNKENYEPLNQQSPNSENHQPSNKENHQSSGKARQKPLRKENQSLNNNNNRHPLPVCGISEPWPSEVEKFFARGDPTSGDDFLSRLRRPRRRLPLKNPQLFAERRNAALCAMEHGLQLHTALRTLPGVELGERPCAVLLWYLTRLHLLVCGRWQTETSTQSLTPRQARNTRLFFRKLALRLFDNGPHTGLTGLVNAFLTASLRQLFYVLRLASNMKF